MNETKIYRVNEYSGFRIYKLNDFTARYMVKKAYYDAHLELVEGKVVIFLTSGNSNLTSFSSSMDLFDYNNNLLFSSEKSSYLGKFNIILF